MTPSRSFDLFLPFLFLSPCSFFSPPVSSETREVPSRDCERARVAFLLHFFSLAPFRSCSFLFFLTASAILLLANPEASVKTKRISSRNKETLTGAKRRLDRSLPCWLSFLFPFSIFVRFKPSPHPMSPFWREILYPSWRKLGKVGDFIV